MSKKITLTEEIVCDVCGKTINGSSCKNRMGALYMNGGSIVNYSMRLTLSSQLSGDVEHICKDCLKEFLECLAKEITY